MPKAISANEAKNRLGSHLAYVSQQDDEVIVKSHGRPKGVIMSMWKQRRQRFFTQMRETAEQANLSEEEAVQLTDEVKQAVRAQR